MTDNDTIARSGEQRLKDRRKSFWRYMTIAFVIALLAGMASGFAGDMFEVGSLPLWVPVIIWVVVMAGFIWFTRDYFRRVDELDLMDNLWAHLVGFYAILVIFGSWYMAWEIELLPEPDALVIVLGGLLVMFIAYGLRKLGLR